MATQEIPSQRLDVPSDAIVCPADIHDGGTQAPARERMPVLASDGKLYYNWKVACTSGAAWYYRFDHPKTREAVDEGRAVLDP